MKAIITRPCEYMGRTYTHGDEITDEQTAAKLVRLRFAQYEKGEEPAPPPPVQSGRTDYDPAAHSADEVKVYAADHPTEVSAIVAKETDGKNRATVIAALNAMLTTETQRG